MPQRPTQHQRRGFTLIELLTSVGIIGTISAVVVTAINPTLQMAQTADAKRRQRVNQMEKAISQYVVEYGAMPGDSTIPAGVGNAEDICRDGVVDASCINLNGLVPTFLACLPHDGAQTGSVLTGFRVYQQAGVGKVTSIFVDTSDSSTGGSCEAPPKPIAHWKMNEILVGDTLDDVSGNEHDGTAYNFAVPEGPSTDRSNTIKFANPRSLQLDGSSDYVSVDYHTSFDLTTGLTIAGWVKGDSWGSSDDVDTIVRKGEANPNTWQLAVMDGVLSLMLDGSDSPFASIQGTTTLDTGTWYHVAGTWDGSTGRVYVNGTEENAVSHTTALSTDTRPIYVGGRDGTDILDGYLDDVRVYNEALEAGHIAALATGHE